MVKPPPPELLNGMQATQKTYLSWELNRQAHEELLAAVHKSIALTAREGWTEYGHVVNNVHGSWWYCTITEVSQWRNPGDDFTICPLTHPNLHMTVTGRGALG